ncbi:MAG TPA: 50S ribosomal protein L11, partial [Acidimicrobiales bacterium]|nr:50S ribosomal protein L11 [Acidimicrobiales bacterium]
MGKKKIRTVLKLELQAGKATPAPPVGTALGPHGINIMEFCRAYNERTAQQAGDVVPAEITVFEDRSFTFVLRTPPTVNMLKKAAGIDKGSPKPNRDKVGKVSKEQLVQIAT